jgi:hypothetical protein
LRCFLHATWLYFPSEVAYGEKNGEVSHGRKNGHQFIKEKRNGITLIKKFGYQGKLKGLKTLEVG